VPWEAQELALIDRFGYTPEQLDQVEDIARLFRFLKYDAVKDREKARRDRIASLRKK
jgi:hypothetical protein